MTSCQVIDDVTLTSADIGGAINAETCGPDVNRVSGDRNTGSAATVRLAIVPYDDGATTPCVPPVRVLRRRRGVDHVNSTASADVVLVAWTQFAPPADAELITTNGTRWQSDADGGQALAEFAGARLLPVVGQAESGDRDERRISATHPRGRSPIGHRARERDVLHHRRLAIADPRVDPAPALFLQPAVTALRAVRRCGDGRARSHRGRSGTAPHLRRGDRREPDRVP